MILVSNPGEIEVDRTIYPRNLLLDCFQILDALQVFMGVVSIGRDFLDLLSESLLALWVLDEVGDHSFEEMRSGVNTSHHECLELLKDLLVRELVVVWVFQIMEVECLDNGVRNGVRIFFQSGPSFFKEFR